MSVRTIGCHLAVSAKRAVVVFVFTFGGVLLAAWPVLDDLLSGMPGMFQLASFCGLMAVTTDIGIRLAGLRGWIPGWER